MSKTPGIYIETEPPRLSRGFQTGVPAFVGVARQGPIESARRIELYSQYEQEFGVPQGSDCLGHAIRGFFENGGSHCYVVRTEGIELNQLERGLSELQQFEDVDLIAAPDIAIAGEVAELQAMLLHECGKQDGWFAILDAPPHDTGSGVDRVEQAINHANRLRRHHNVLTSDRNGALYYPRLRVSTPPFERAKRAGSSLDESWIPACGHVAGAFNRSDRQFGARKAPANEVLDGVLDLEYDHTREQQGDLNEAGVNALRILPNRGIRVWGARTLSVDPNWRYINVRRVFLTVTRWIRRHMVNVSFEPNDSKLWARITRELTVYLTSLFEQGRALLGDTAKQAFFVKCDAETNPPEVIDAGMVVTEVKIAVNQPNEFIQIRIVQDAGELTITGV